MDPVTMTQQATDAAATMIASLRDDELSRPTPCSEWDVRGLVNHMIQVCQTFGSAADGAAAVAPPGAAASAADLAAAYRTAAARSMAAWRAPGAMERTITLRAGEMPGAAAVGVQFGDQLVHVWDLAKATGRAYPLPAELATACLESSRARITPDRRGPGKPFAEEVPCPESAPVHDRLAAFMGRQLS